MIELAYEKTVVFKVSPWQPNIGFEMTQNIKPVAAQLQYMRQARK